MRFSLPQELRVKNCSVRESWNLSLELVEPVEDDVDACWDCSRLEAHHEEPFSVGHDRERHSCGKLPAAIEETSRFARHQTCAALNISSHHGVSLSVVQTVSAWRPGRFVAACGGHLYPFALPAEGLHVHLIPAGSVGNVGDQPAVRRKAGKQLVGFRRQPGLGTASG